MAGHPADLPPRAVSHALEMEAIAHHLHKNEPLSPDLMRQAAFLLALAGGSSSTYAPYEVVDRASQIADRVYQAELRRTAQANPSKA